MNRTLTRRKFIVGTALGLGAASQLMQNAQAADASDWPNRPIRLIVPLPPGGGADIVARLLAERLTPRLGQNVLIDNRPGGGTMIGAQLVANAKPDGYTLLLGTATNLATMPSMVEHLPYNIVTSFSPIALVANLPLVLVLNPEIPATTLGELVDYVRARPGTLSFASTGDGSSDQLAGEMLKIDAKLDVTHIPYQGASPALVDLLGGRVKYMFSTIPPVLPYIQSGKLRGLCVASVSRTALLSSLPSTTELGYPGVVASSWNGILAPAHTPKTAIDRIGTELHAVMQMPDIQERLAKVGVEPRDYNPQQFAQFIQSEYTRYARVIKISGAKID